MERIKLENVLAKVNEKYVEAKIKNGDYNPSYHPPEYRPQIYSNQVKALASVLVDEINQALEDLKKELSCPPKGTNSKGPR